jgi:Fe-S cluster assembly protein SufB
MKTEADKLQHTAIDESLSTIEKTVLSDYKYGFVTDIESDDAPKGLSETTVRFISAKKNEPQWMLDWRLKAYRHWLTLAAEEPTWANLKYPPIDYQDMIYYSAPKQKVGYFAGRAKTIERSGC